MAATPKRYFEFVDGTSNKFWEIWMDGNDVTTSGARSAPTARPRRRRSRTRRRRRRSTTSCSRRRPARVTSRSRAPREAASRLSRPPVSGAASGRTAHSRLCEFPLPRNCGESGWSSRVIIRYCRQEEPWRMHDGCCNATKDDGRKSSSNFTGMNRTSNSFAASL